MQVRYWYMVWGFGIGVLYKAFMKEINIKV